LSNNINITAFENEVRRWNKQFSLISRQNSEPMLQQLICESLESYSTFIEWAESSNINLNSFKLVNYFDIGSGAGFPGIIWQSLFERDFGSKICGRLIEPREKRAWFLERCSRMQGHSKLRVVNERWNKRYLSDSNLLAESINIVSIKALFLTDAEILKELPGLTPTIVCRFHNPQTPLDSHLIKKLELPDNAQIVKFPSGDIESSVLISNHTNCST